METIRWNVLQLIARYVKSYRGYRRRARTERILNDLPPAIRKDIGWPRDFD